MHGELGKDSPKRRLRQPAFGIERIGLLTLAYPLLAIAMMVILSVAAVFGAARLKVDDSLSQLFRSDTADFAQYETFLRRFPSSEFDVLAVVEGDTLLTRDSLRKLRDIAIDVQLVDGVRGVVSLFSARHLPENGQAPAPIVPDTLPEGDAYDKLVERIRSNEIIRGKLLSDDGRLALVVVPIDQKVVASKGLSDVIDKIRKTFDQGLEGAGLKVGLSGAPVMQLEIRKAVERDRLILNTFGFLAGCIVAALFFRRISFIVIAAAPPLLAILWSLGLLGWLDFRLNMFLNVMTPLIMVMGFSDSMQMTFAARDRLLAGDTKSQAMRYAVLHVGPAAVITSATTALSFLTLLLFSDSQLIRTFGAAGAIACAVSFFAVVGLMPLAGILLLRGNDAAASVNGSDAAIDALRRLCIWCAARMIRRPALYSVISLLVIGSLVLVYTNLEPRYRLADQVPEREAVEASQRLDVALTGANPIHIQIEFPDGADLYAPETLRVIAEAHGVMEEQAGVGNVWSLENLRRWLARAGINSIAELKRYVSVLPVHVTRRFIAADQAAAVVTGRIPDRQAHELLPVISQLEQRLAGVQARHPGFKMSVTGLSAVAARNSASMIGQLTLGLTVAIPFAAALIGIAYRSLMMMAVSILPGLFPIVISGAVLWVLDEGLQFASIVALIVAFGLGLDATVHYINRLRIEEAPGERPEEGVMRATRGVGPALILTTLVLACGLIVTIFSSLPSLQLFGWLSAFTLMAALAGDLLILPATVMLLRRLGGQVRS